MPDPEKLSSEGVPISWEREPTGVTTLPDDPGESPLQRIDRRMGNVQKGTEVAIVMIKEHSANDERALKEINDRISTQDTVLNTRLGAQDKVQLEHTIELRAQSRQLDTIVRVIAPRSGAMSSELRAEIAKQIDNSDKGYKRARNLKLFGIIGAIIVATLGAAGGIAAIISALRG